MTTSFGSEARLEVAEIVSLHPKQPAHSHLRGSEVVEVAHGDDRAITAVVSQSGFSGSTNLPPDRIRSHVSGVGESGVLPLDGAFDSEHRLPPTGAITVAVRVKETDEPLPVRMHRHTLWHLLDATYRNTAVEAGIATVLVFSLAQI